ncbi:MAG: nitronate monooxygenase [Spirochaetota bacterium]|nr:nitronate monooxygenase [Spirochaetota bacterium]
MEWNTKITELLGCKYPIIQGAYHGFGTSALAAPVSEAGAFGLITASALHTPEKLREDIQRARSMTDKPFGINLTIGLFPGMEEMMEVAIEEKIPVVETAAFKAEEYGKKLKQAGIKWIHKVATVKHAVTAEKYGADAVVIVGLEGTGFKHISQLPTLVNISWATRLIKIPIIAAGGIADAHGFLASLCLGAEGVYLGTAFMATKECPISDRFKEALVKADPTDPKYRDRCLAPPKAEEYERAMQKRGKVATHEWLRELEMTLLKSTSEERDSMKDIDSMDMSEEILRSAGGSLAVAAIDRVLSVKELIDAIIKEAEEILHSGKFPTGA